VELPGNYYVRRSAYITAEAHRGCLGSHWHEMRRAHLVVWRAWNSIGGCGVWNKGLLLEYKVVVSRAEHSILGNPTPETLCAGDIELDPQRRTVKKWIGAGNGYRPTSNFVGLFATNGTASQRLLAAISRSSGWTAVIHASACGVGCRSTQIIGAVGEFEERID
jgi:hypothetical protein